MERLLIVGAGGFGREVLGWLNDIPVAKRHWNVAGFLDDNPQALNGYSLDCSIVGQPSTYIPAPTDILVCAIGNPINKLWVCRDLKARGAQFLTVIHPTAIVGPHCTIGEGCLLCPGAIVTTNVTVGNFVTLNVYATVGHDAVIGDGCTLSGHTDVTGFCRIGEGVFTGSHVAVLPGTTVGDYAVLGSGSVILRRVKPRSTVMGVPAKQIAGFEG